MTFAPHNELVSHGYYDTAEREFRGFGRVDQRDTESFGTARGSGVYAGELANEATEFARPPTFVRSWFHSGAHVLEPDLIDRYRIEWFQGDPQEPILGSPVLPPDLTVVEEREASRALKGRPIRSETYALDGSPLEPVPYAVTEHRHRVRRLRPARRVHGDHRLPGRLPGARRPAVRYGRSAWCDVGPGRHG